MEDELIIYGIAFGCPKLKRDKHCPLLEVEHLSLQEKVDWVEKLDEKSKTFILRHHSCCTKKE